MKSSVKTLFIWLLLLFAVMGYWQFTEMEQSKSADIKFSALMDMVEAGRVASVHIRGSEITGAFKDDGGRFKTTAPVAYQGLWEELLKNKVTVEYEEPNTSGGWAVFILNLLPFGLLILFWIVFMRQMNGSGNRALSFGRSKAKLLNQSGKKITFKDVAGVEEAKDELREIIDFLKDPQKFQKLGGKIPKGVLLMGPPGTGKTLLARSVAGEAGVPFFSLSGSDFVEMFVGVGASRVRDLFEQGKKNAPCIIFIDEIDAVGRHRGAGLGGGHDEREQTLNQLLVEMDGFESNEGVILIAATNRPDVLDPAMLRPGRFDRRVVVSRPDVTGRHEILKIHTRRVPMEPDIDLSVTARNTSGFTGADLANLVNEAALLAAREGRNAVAATDLDKSRDKVLMGTERKSMVISEADKRVTAFHEAGHALVAVKLSEYTDPLHKVTIIPRGMALGLTQQLPENDKYSMTKMQLEARIAVCMGGRVAEELRFKDISTGAGNDMEQATDLARKMVCAWGMSPHLGPITYGKEESLIFLGKEMGRQQNYSEETARAIDEAIKNIVTDQYIRARRILTEDFNALTAIAEALLKHETLDKKQIDEIIETTSGTMEI